MNGITDPKLRDKKMKEKTLTRTEKKIELIRQNT